MANSISGSIPVLTGLLTERQIANSRIGGTMPLLSAEITAHSGFNTVKGTLPALDGAVVAKSGRKGSLAGTLPTLTGAVHGIVNGKGAIVGTLPALTAVITAKTSKLGQISGTLPTLTGAITGRVIPIGHIAGTLPTLSGSVKVLAAIGNTAVVALNLFTKAVSEYTNYGFNSLVELDGKYYGLKADGIYLLEGATDNGTAIDITLETGLTDFGTSKGKGIADIYTASTLDGSVTVTAITDNATRRCERTITPTNPGTPGHFRTRYPYSLLSRYWGVSISNVNGARASIDGIELETGTDQLY